MVDQVRNLKASGVEAVVISSVSRQSVDEEFLAKLCCIQSGEKYLKTHL